MNGSTDEGELPRLFGSPFSLNLSSKYYSVLPLYHAFVGATLIMHSSVLLFSTSICHEHLFAMCGRTVYKLLKLGFVLFTTVNIPGLDAFMAPPTKVQLRRLYRQITMKVMEVQYAGGSSS